jgi:hypothetical protein
LGVPKDFHKAFIASPYLPHQGGEKDFCSLYENNRYLLYYLIYLTIDHFGFPPYMVVYSPDCIFGMKSTKV